MSKDTHLEEVRSFYDSHPISLPQILEKLDRDGVDLRTLTEDTLQAYDQDHYSGVAANDALAELADLAESDHVLDICCGLGGPARYIARHYGCRVTGVDLTGSRIEGAAELTRMTGQADRVTFLCADAMSMPLPDDGFDVAISQEAFCHIPDKDKLLQETARLMKPGGRLAFTDIVGTDAISDATRQRLERELALAGLCTIPEYCQRLERAGFAVQKAIDLGETWREILIERLAMYRSLKDQTVERFGQAHFDNWDSAYAFFVDQYRTGDLSGVRLLATRL
ncbi:class I SAM-dependent methyltransferase [Ruegeria jejuensis]|uniref:class I SAM-dependent methyltransferase n=1 Tax=Ruegeria jejuensis TaxID=3233338 RepID=UPI00355C75B0